MTPTEAAKLLELPDNATPEQIEARFLELRRKLEDKIAKAPTPGLQAKYRESLTEITTAFETLALAADSSALPVLAREQGTGSREKGRGAEAGDRRPEAGGSGPAPSSVHPSPATRRKSSREFVLVAIIAVAVLGAGGWFIMKTRAENAEQARIAAEAKAEAERLAEEKRLATEAEQARLAEERRLAEEEKVRQAAAEKAEQERRDRELALLRSRLAQLNVQAESLFVEEPTKAARRLSELKSDERALAREKESGALVRLRAQVDAQQGYVDELDAVLTRHPAKSTQARATELVSARELDSATEAVAQFAEQLTKLDELMTESRQRLENALHGSLQIENPHADVQWVLTDAFGERRSGRGSADLATVGIGTGTVVFSRSGWPELRRNVLVRRGARATVTADFRPAQLSLTATPPGATFSIPGGPYGKTPAEIEVIPGRIKLSVQAYGYAPQTEELELKHGETRTLQFTLQTEPMWIQGEATALANSLTTFVSSGYAYYGSILALPGNPADVGLVVSSALPLTLQAPSLGAVPPTALQARGQPVSVNYGMWQNSRWVGTGGRNQNLHVAPVAESYRSNVGGAVYIAGMYEVKKRRWAILPAVFATSHPDLVPVVQQWANSLQVTPSGPVPAPHINLYRVFFVLKFRAP